MAPERSCSGRWNATRGSRSLRLSRNFGHQIALTAGVDFSTGDAVIILDADLQDPPEVVLELAAKWREGWDVVYAVRDIREGDTWFKRNDRRLVLSDFQPNLRGEGAARRRRLQARRPESRGRASRGMRESNRFVRGMSSWVGLRQTGVLYRRDERFAGKTKYPLRKMLRFATSGLISFSPAPLRFALRIGFLVSILSFALGYGALSSS